jgi:hydroxymethylbilane synthase
VTVRIGTRASKLALTQTQQTADQLAAIGGFPVELVHIRTDGDVLTGSLSQMGGTGVFVAALRDALLRDQCDVAVHSLKDLPTGAAPGLTLAATPKRVDVRDVLCARDGFKLADLPQGARVGTGSPRRAAQLRAARPDLEIVDIRGNVDTRLGRVPGLPGNATDAVVDGKSCDLDAVVLAAAGLERISRLDAISEYLETDVMLPAAGQGSLAIECRTADAPRKSGSTEGSQGSQGPLAQALAALDDTDTRLAVTAERALLARLEAGCAAPVGAYAFRKGSMLYLEAVVCAVDGKASVRDKRATDGLTEVGATLLGIELAEVLLAAGAADIADLAAS